MFLGSIEAFIGSFKNWNGRTDIAANIQTYIFSIVIQTHPPNVGEYCKYIMGRHNNNFQPFSWILVLNIIFRFRHPSFHLYPAPEPPPVKNNLHCTTINDNASKNALHHLSAHLIWPTHWVADSFQYDLNFRYSQTYPAGRNRISLFRVTYHQWKEKQGTHFLPIYLLEEQFLAEMAE